MGQIRKITIGNSPITKTIFAGHLNSKGNLWSDKQDLTIDVLMATVNHCLKWGNQEIKDENGSQEFLITVCRCFVFKNVFLTYEI